MLRTKLLLIAEGVALDQSSKNISAFNILDSMQSQAFPVMVPKLHVVHVIERDLDDPADFEWRLQLERGGQVLFESTRNMTFGNDAVRTRALVDLRGLTITQPGNIDFVVQVNNAEIGRYRLEVSPPPPALDVQQAPEGPGEPNG